jgi:hypothetical protein
MILANSISVGLSLFIIAVVSKEKIFRIGKDRGIAQTFQRWLLLCIILAYAVTSIFTYHLQTGIAETQVKANFTTTMSDVVTDVKLKSDSTIIKIAEKVKYEYVNNMGVDLNTLLKGEDLNGDKYEICEINIVSNDGIIEKSTDKAKEGFNFYETDNEQPKQFLDLLGNKENLVQDFSKNAVGELRKYAGIKIEDGFIQVAYNQKQFRATIDEFIIDVTKNRHVGAMGFIAVCDENLKIVSETGVNEKHISVLLNEEYASLKTNVVVATDGTITITPYSDKEYKLNLWTCWGYWYHYLFKLESKDIEVTLNHAYGSAKATINVVEENFHLLTGLGMFVINVDIEFVALSNKA